MKQKKITVAAVLAVALLLVAFAVQAAANTMDAWEFLPAQTAGRVEPLSAIAPVTENVSFREYMHRRSQWRAVSSCIIQ